MTRLQQFCKDALHRMNAHGMVDTAAQCGCHLDDFAPCCTGPYSHCEAAVRVIVPKNGKPIDPLIGEPVTAYLSARSSDYTNVDFAMVPWRRS